MIAPRRAVALLAAIGLVVAGGALVGDQLQSAATAEETTGVVESVELDRYERVGRPRLGGSTYYVPNVTYAYSVDGRRYVGDAVALGTGLNTNVRWRASRVVAPFDSGDRVTVSYDPDAPEQSWLRERYDFLPGFGAVGLGLLLGVDALTPGTRLVRAVYSRLPKVGRGERSRADSGGVGEGNPWDDPEGVEIGDGSGAETAAASDADDAPLSGWAALGAWIGWGVAVLGLVGGYVALSVPPYDFGAHATVVVVAAAAVRAVVRKRL